MVSFDKRVVSRKIFPDSGYDLECLWGTKVDKIEDEIEYTYWKIEATPPLSLSLSLFCPLRSRLSIQTRRICQREEIHKSSSTWANALSNIFSTPSSIFVHVPCIVHTSIHSPFSFRCTRMFAIMGDWRSRGRISAARFSLAEDDDDAAAASYMTFTKCSDFWIALCHVEFTQPQLLSSVFWGPPPHPLWMSYNYGALLQTPMAADAMCDIIVTFYLTPPKKDKCPNCNMCSFPPIRIVHRTAMQCWSGPKGADVVEDITWKEKPWKAELIGHDSGRHTQELIQFSLFSTAEPEKGRRMWEGFWARR